MLFLPFHAIASEAVQTLENNNVSQPAWILSDPSTNVISMQLTFSGGITYDPNGKEGLTSLLGDMMTSGAGHMNAARLAEMIKDHAISLNISSRRDDTIVSLTAPARYWDTATELTKDVLLHPTFDQGEMERMIAAQTASIRSDLADPDWRAMRLMNGIVFQSSPYARPGSGSVSSVNRITRSDFSNIHKRIFGSKPVQAVFVGDVDQNKAEKMLAVFEGMPAAAEITIPDMRQWGKGNVAYHHTYNVPQTSLYYILPGVSPTDPDYAALTILNAWLSDGFGSRLMKALREESGLSYGVSGGVSDAKGGAIWVFSVRVGDGEMAKAADILRREIASTATTPAKQEEIDQTAKTLAAQLPMGWTSSPAIAGQLAEAQRQGFGPDYLATWQKRLLAVRAEDVQQLAKRLLANDRNVMIAVGRTKPENSGWVEQVQLPNMD